MVELAEGGKECGERSSSIFVELFHFGLELEELVSPPDMLDLEGARLVPLVNAEGGGGLERKGNRLESRFFLTSWTIALSGAGFDTAD